MVEYQLTHQDALAMFFNSIFLGEKLGYKSDVINRMIKEVYLDVGDVKEQLKETRPEIAVPGYVSPDGKVIVLDERYVGQQLGKYDLSRFREYLQNYEFQEVGVNEEYLLHLLYDVIQQSAMDHEALGHSYPIFSGEINKLRKKIRKELSLKKVSPSDYEKEGVRMLKKRTELLASEAQIKCAEYRMRVCQDGLTKIIWKVWTKILKEEYNKTGVVS